MTLDLSYGVLRVEANAFFVIDMCSQNLSYRRNHIKITQNHKDFTQETKTSIKHAQYNNICHMQDIHSTILMPSPSSQKLSSQSQQKEPTKHLPLQYTVFLAKLSRVHARTDVHGQR
jgi:hypothetical protein